MGVLRTTLRRALLAMVPAAALIRARTEQAPGCLQHDFRRLPNLTLSSPAKLLTLPTGHQFSPSTDSVNLLSARPAVFSATQL